MTARVGAWAGVCAVADRNSVEPWGVVSVKPQEEDFEWAFL